MGSCKSKPTPQPVSRPAPVAVTQNHSKSTAPSPRDPLRTQVTPLTPPATTEFEFVDHAKTLGQLRPTEFEYVDAAQNLGQLKAMQHDLNHLNVVRSEVQRIKRELEAKLGQFKSKSIEKLDKTTVNKQWNQLAKDKIVTERLRRQSEVRQSLTGGFSYGVAQKNADQAKKYFKSFNERYGRKKAQKAGRLHEEYGMAHAKREKLQDQLDLLNAGVSRSISHVSQKSDLIQPVPTKGLRNVETRRPTGKADFLKFKQMKSLRSQSILARKAGKPGNEPEIREILKSRDIVLSGDSASVNPQMGEFKSTHIIPLPTDEVDKLNANRTHPKGKLSSTSSMINSELGVVAGQESRPLRRLSSGGRGDTPKQLKDLESEALHDFSERKVEKKPEAFENFAEDKPRETVEERISKIKVEYQDSLEQELEIAQALADELEQNIERITQDLDEMSIGAMLQEEAKLKAAEKLAGDCAKHLRKASEKYKAEEEA